MKKVLLAGLVLKRIGQRFGQAPYGESKRQFVQTLAVGPPREEALRKLLIFIIGCAVAVPADLSAQASGSGDQTANSIAAAPEVLPSNWSLSRPKTRKNGIPRRGGTVARVPASTGRETAKPRIYGGVNVRSGGKRQKGNGQVGVAIPF